MPPAPASADPASRNTPERRAADSLLCGLLLAFTGGSLDAFLYLNHGHVFAGAMTGNAVLCGVALLGRDDHSALHHALPILAFIVGVWAAEMLQDRLRHHAVSTGLACEAGGLLLCSLAPPGFPELAFVPLVSFLAAYQVASFRKADIYSYNSTFITGDLRTLIVGLYEALHPEHQSEGLRQAGALGLVVLGFLAGAVSGAALAPHFANRTLWLPCSVLLVVLAITVVRGRLLGSAAEPRAALDA